MPQSQVPGYINHAHSHYSIYDNMNKNTLTPNQSSNYYPSQSPVMMQGKSFSPNAPYSNDELSDDRSLKQDI